MRQTTSPSLSAAAYRAARRLRLELARRDINAFAEFVAKDEETGAPVRQAPLHRAWHQLLDRHPLLVLWAPIMHGKSWQISILRSVWLLGSDASMRIVLASNAAKQSGKFLKVVAQLIESRAVRQVFPALRPARGLPWNSEMLTVERPGIASDPSVQLISLHGNILSARVDAVWVDDILDYESVRTPAQREDTIAWFHNAILGRLSVRGRVAVLGVSQHKQDLMHYLAARTPPWAAYRFGAIDSSGTARWPEKWPLDRILSKRAELGPAESARQIDCRAAGSEGGIVQMEYIQPSLQRGEGLRTLDRYPHQDLPYDPDIRIIHGVDLGARRTRKSDLTSIFSIAVNAYGIRQVIGVQAFRLIGQPRIDRLSATHRFFGGTFVVENNGFQQEVVERFRNFRRGVDIIERTTGKGESSLDWQVDRLVAELSRGDWVIPNMHGACEPEVSKWIDELLEYDPNQHTGDRLAAACLARWGSDRGAVRGERFSMDLLSR